MQRAEEPKPLVRVRWGTQNFLRINEFATEAAALAFAAQLQDIHGDRPSMKIQVERREGDDWAALKRRSR